MIRQGHEPRLITSHRGAPSTRVEDGLTVVRHWRPPEERLRSRLFTEHLTHLPFTYASLVTGRDDLVHSLYPTDTLAAVRWAERTGRPTVFTVPGLARREAVANRRLRLDVLRRATRDVDALVAISHAAARSLERWLGVESRVIHQGVDLAVFRRTAPRAEEPTIFCAADPADPRKRVDVLRAAFRRLRREIPTARLVLIRPGGNQSAASAGPADDGVEIVDTLGRDDALLDHYSSAWVTVLPAAAEAFGLVLLESLACGTPVIGADDGAVPEVLEGCDAARLFALDDEEDLARALLEGLELAESPDVAGRARSHAERFSADACARAYEALYRELLAIR